MEKTYGGRQDGEKEGGGRDGRSKHAIGTALLLKIQKRAATSQSARHTKDKKVRSRLRKSRYGFH